MRLYSTPESANNLEPTWLAVFEVPASVAICVAIATHLETTKYIAAAVSLAPIALLRTERSVALGLKWKKRIWDTFDRDVEPLLTEPAGATRWTRAVNFMRHGTMSLSLGSRAMLVRPLSTLWAAVLSPADAAGGAPGNWYRQVLCVDSAHLPEQVPGELLDPEVEDLRAGLAEIDFRSWTGFWDSYPGVVGLVIFYAPPLLYRITFKATAIVYAPLIWVVHSTVHHGLPSEGRLTRLKSGELEKLRRKWSAFAFGLLVAKAAVVLGWLPFEHLQERVPSPQILDAFVVPDAIPLWQAAVGVNCTLTFILLWFTDAALPRLENNTWREAPVAGTVTALSFARGFLSLYTVASGFLIAWGLLDLS